MGYTHYLYTALELDKEKFKAVVQDFKKILPNFEHLLGQYGGGVGKPIITNSEIGFNGIGENSHETFVVTRRNKKQSFQGDGEDKAFSFCKTARKPYDIAVTSCLVIVKHHFGDEVKVSSDGDYIEWDDAMTLCQKTLGYGTDFKFDREVET